MADTRKRFRFTVPPNDAVVMAWLAAQENIGMSLRQLIKLDSLAGISDVMCRPLPGQAEVPEPFRQAALKAEEERIAKKIDRQNRNADFGTPVSAPGNAVSPIPPAAAPRQTVTAAPGAGQETPAKGEDMMSKWF